MASAFSSNDTECLSRDVEHEFKIENIAEIWNNLRLEECVRWINEHQFTKVCLQFPDDLLTFSIKIMADLKENTSTDLCILGDTSYGSCCVDEVAASHFAADTIIHFGHACLSKVTRLPVLYIFPNFTLNTTHFMHKLESMVPNTGENLTVFYATEYFYQLDEIKLALASYTNVTFGELALDGVPDNLCWKMPTPDLSDSICVFIGSENQSFFNLTITVKAKQWLSYDPQDDIMKTVSNPLATNWMRRRNFCVEKCKDARSLGIVVGTLTANGYLDIVKHIQTLARNRGKRVYLLSVGKINPAKLANFMEIDCFVFVGCPENNIYTSREFYKPLVSIFEAELALNPAWHEQYPDFYSVDFKELLPDGKHHRQVIEKPNSEDYDVSLVTGRVRSLKTTSDTETNKGDETQIERKSNQLMESNSSDTFKERSWTGLSPSLGQQEPAKITKGRSGIPIKYSENVE